MRLILSRKGFDSAAGGVASPIFPDRTMYSLPIQAAGAQKSYRELGKGGRTGCAIGTVVEHLTGGRVSGDALAHFDPDLDEGTLPRLAGWRPCFAQTSSSQSHLASCGVDIGDLFLFFGWFRQVTQQSSRGWSFAPGTRNQHVVFGWLQIGEIIRVDEFGPDRILHERPWLKDHPHLHFGPDPQNVIYVASDRLVLPGLGPTDLPGAAEIGQFCEELVLTAPGSQRRGLWRLPTWFSPQHPGGALTYHSEPGRWKQVGPDLQLSTVGRGQEFVLNCSQRPAVGKWLLNMLAASESLRGAA
jgi:hypothetical protein